MPQVIEIPGLGEVEFPDDMSDADIVSAITRLNAPPPAATESGARGAFQGLSAGFGDELSAGLTAALPFLDREAAGQGTTIGDRYRNARGFYRGLNSRAETSNPGAYTTSQIAGGVVPMLTGAGPAQVGVKGLLKAAGMGAMSGAGYSEANDGTRLLRDSGIGAALGGVGFGLGKGLSAGYGAVRRKAVDLAGRASGRAAQEGAEAASAPVRSLEASARERAANAYRQVERINKALADPALSASDRTALQAFQQSPEYAELVALNARGVLSAAPDAAAELSAARQIAAEARDALPDEIKRQTAARLVPQPKADAKSFLKAYAEPVAWAVGANKLAESMGADTETQMAAAGVAGLIGGRTRAGKALMTRLNRPAHQLVFANKIQSMADKTEPLTRALMQRGLPAAMAAAMATREEP